MKSLENFEQEKDETIEIDGRKCEIIKGPATFQELRNKERGIENEIVEVEGKKYEKIQTGYTIKEYFSHGSLEKGPGPGWDNRFRVLPKIGINPTYSKDYPDEPYFQLREIEE